MSLLRWRLHATLYLETGDYDAERGEAALTLRTLKVRDAERPAPLRLVRRRVNWRRGMPKVQQPRETAFTTSRCSPTQLRSMLCEVM